MKSRAAQKRKKPIQPAVRLILREIESVLSKLDERSVAELADAIVNSEKIVTIGAGRVGLATKGFAMRLGHLGFNAYAIGDMTVPSLKGGKHMALIASGSGETPSIAILAEIAKKNGAKVALITANPESRMGRIADIVVRVPAPTKHSKPSERSKQPMTTLNEQCLHVFFDALVLSLMRKLDESHDTMWDRHSNLE
jgi:6-phospho-3-hexuloisomerase